MQKEKIDAYYRSIDRSIFLDGGYKDSAGLDAPLPIGFGQTISQPSLVLTMTRHLELDKGQNVLEIGTGSGYQTAFLAEFAGKVFTVERIQQLSEKARRTLEKLGYKNVYYKIGDGSEGWRQYAPFDRVITTAAAGCVPEKLLEQLKPGGIAVMPVGPASLQQLLKIKKDKDGGITAVSLGGVRFVEMKGKYGWEQALKPK